MISLANGLNIATRALAVSAAAIIFGLMALTVVDVGGRYFFRAPLPGAFEITRLALGTLIFVRLPGVCLRDGHIKVDLLASFLRGGFGGLVRRTVDLLCAAVLAFFAWRLVLQGQRLTEYGQTTQELELSLAPIAWFMAVMAALSCLTLVATAIRGRPTGSV